MLRVRWRAPSEGKTGRTRPTAIVEAGRGALWVDTAELLGARCCIVGADMLIFCAHAGAGRPRGFLVDAGVEGGEMLRYCTQGSLEEQCGEHDGRTPKALGDVPAFA